jgi:hypothetical protein
MYKQNRTTPTTLKVNQTYEGERIEEKIQRIVNNKEPITDGAPIIYTERKEGVQPQYNIRTDRWEVAIDAMDKVSKSYKAKRDMGIGERAFDNMTIEQKTEFTKKYPNSHKAKGWTPPTTEGKA